MAVADEQFARLIANYIGAQSWVAPCQVTVNGQSPQPGRLFYNDTGCCFLPDGTTPTDTSGLLSMKWSKGSLPVLERTAEGISILLLAGIRIQLPTDHAQAVTRIGTARSNVPPPIPGRTPPQDQAAQTAAAPPPPPPRPLASPSTPSHHQHGPPNNPPTTASGTNGLAIASLVLSIGLAGIGSVLGVILGHISLRQIRRTPGQGGRALAVAGVVIGYVTLAAVALLIVISVPVYRNQVNSADNSAVESDLRNAAIAQEAFFVTNDEYASSMDELKSMDFEYSNPSHYEGGKALITAHANGSTSYCLEATTATGVTSHYSHNTLTYKGGLNAGPCP